MKKIRANPFKIRENHLTRMTCSILPPLTFLAKSLGCRTNQAEMETFSLQFTDYGLQQIGDGLLITGQPNIVLLNTCVVTSKAEKETRKEIRNLRKKYPNAFIVVLGCAVTAKEKYTIDLPSADLFISNKDKNKSAKIILHSFFHCQPLTEIHDRKFLSIYDINKYHNSGRKFIKIQDGCDQYCSYCITCYLRGKPTNAPPKKIIEEINFWIGKGIKEIILTGINIGLYGFDSGQARMTSLEQARMTITNLVNQILKETSVERITFSSIYPEMLTDDFMKLVIGNPRITQCFHLSLQSGSQTVLEKMNRKTNLDELLKKLRWIKEKNPNFTFRADIITGFPDETEKEFQETLDYIKKARISFAHIFTYSARKGTKAYEMIKSRKWEDLSESVKKERSEKIRIVVEKIRKEEAEKMIDSVFHCLIVRKIQCHSRESGNLYRFQVKPGMTMYEGITENGWPVRVRVRPARFALRSKAGGDRARTKLKGKILPVKIIDFKNDQLFGEIVVLPTKGTKTSGISTLPSAF